MANSNTIGIKDKFYEDGQKYWENIPPTVDGMLGGYSPISSTDICGSTKFLKSFISNSDHKTDTKHALDCGAGIGRITKNLLTNFFDKVDMVDVDQKFIDNAPKYLGEKAKKVDKYICCGLQDLVIDEKYYDVIWSQWVLGHLTDEHLVIFLKRCKAGLKNAGIIVIKENVLFLDKPEFDNVDSSYTRPLKDLLLLVNQAGLKVLKQEQQKNFPNEIYPVIMLALQ